MDGLGWLLSRRSEVGLDVSLWFEKAQLAKEPSQSALDAGNLPGAANRAYYSLFAHLTGLLAQLGYEPPPGRGNWPHSTLPRVVRASFKPSFQKRLALALFDRLQTYRVLADCDDHRMLQAEALDGSLRQLGTVLGWEWRAR